MEIIKTLKTTVSDGWNNILTGLFSGKDKRKGFNFTYTVLPASQKWSLYSFDKIIAKIVDLVPKTALKGPIKLKGVNEEEATAVHNLLDSIEFHGMLTDTWIKARLLGGAVWVPEIFDGRTLKEPLNMNNIKYIKKGTVLTNERCYMKKGDEEFLYLYNTTEIEKIHLSRVFIIKGDRCSDDIAYGYYQGFGSSIVDAVYKDVQNYHLAHETPTILLVDFSKPIYNLDGLNKKIGTVKEHEIQSKVSTMESVSSILNAIVLDKEDTYSRVTINTTGIDKLINQPERKLCAITHIPHTLLLNEAPEGGLSAGGKQQQSDFYDYVGFERNNVLTSPIKRFLDIAAVFLKIKSNIDFEFNNLFELDDLEKAKLKKEQADAADKRIKNIIALEERQIITADEARALILKEENLIDSDSRNILNEGSWA